MNQPGEALRWILGTSGPDAGCDRSGELLDQLIEAELAGRAASDEFPEVAAHLASCPDCHEDYVGLREVAMSPPASREETR
jgi:anti-sigma factor RsiW